MSYDNSLRNANLLCCQAPSHTPKPLQPLDSIRFYIYNDLETMILFIVPPSLVPRVIRHRREFSDGPLA